MTGATTPYRKKDDCSKCGGAGSILLLSPSGKTRTALCPQCNDMLIFSRLNEQERKSSLSDIHGNGSAAVLREVGQVILDNPYGFFTAWGGPGSAKTLFLQSMVAGYCKRGVRAAYYHASDLQDGLFEDLHNDDKDNLGAYRKMPVLAIDELDKFYQKDWSRKQLQSLLDWRYRNMATLTTLIACNRDPDEVDSNTGAWLPEDVLSRLHDGRFHRPWPVGVASTGDLMGDEDRGYFVPGVYHVTAGDMRPLLR